MKTRGRWWWKEGWFSICSIHGIEENPDCNMCKLGSWQNLFKVQISNLLFNIKSFVNGKKRIS